MSTAITTPADDVALAKQLHTAYAQLLSEVDRVIVGQKQVIVVPVDVLRHDGRQEGCHCHQ